MSDFKRMKIRINNEAHSRQVQMALFALGYEWANSRTSLWISPSDVLFTDTNGILTHGDVAWAESLSRQDTPWVTLEELLTPSSSLDTNEDEYVPPTARSTPAVLDENGSSNPKAAVGNKSLPTTMLSPLACAVGALGKYNGKLKYGGANYIGTNVVMSVYLDAIRRHLDKILLGEDVDAVDKVPHFGAIMANCDIILSAKAAGTLIDDRLRADGQLEALAALQPLVVSLQELHKEKNPKHYLMANKEADSAR